MLCGFMFSPLDQSLHSCSHSAFFLKSSIYLRLSCFISLFLTCRIQRVQEPSPPPHFFLSLSHSVQAGGISSDTMFKKKKKIALLCVSWRFSLLDKRVLHQSSVDNCVSVPGSAEMVEGIHESHA